MYGVSIPSINGAAAPPVLVAFDLSSFVDGGTNADGSIHQISVTMVGSGNQFPINFNFSATSQSAPGEHPNASTVSIALQPDGKPGRYPVREHQPDLRAPGFIRHAQLDVH